MASYMTSHFQYKIQYKYSFQYKIRPNLITNSLSSNGIQLANAFCMKSQDADTIKKIAIL